MGLGARGTSILFASGDGGVCGVQSQSGTRFIPTFPSTCPYVTSVGGTVGTPETGVNFSGGGFSNYFSNPSYQTPAVSAYRLQVSSRLGLVDLTVPLEDTLTFSPKERRLKKSQWSKRNGSRYFLVLSHFCQYYRTPKRSFDHRRKEPTRLHEPLLLLRDWQGCSQRCDH